MPFTSPTLAQATAALAARLQDETYVRWTAAELALYIREALRVWNAWTAHWRESGTFQTTQLQTFYDLTDVFPTLRGFTLTNHDLITEIEYMLLEPPTPTAWTGTAQFTLERISDAVQGRRDQFLQQTGAVLTHQVTNYAAPAATGRLDLDESILVVHRAAWRPTATQFNRVLRRTDNWSGDHYRPTWPVVSASTPPAGYATIGTPPLQLQLMPPASAAGDLDLVSVNRGPQFTDLTVATLLGVPDDWAWVVKYGALADLLSGDGLQADPLRAKYCDDRWTQGISMAQSASVVLSARITDAVAPIGSLADVDSYDPLWSLLSGAPRRLVLVGQNLLAVIPVANADGYVITLDVVRNAPVPAADGDVLQIGADLYDTILDLAQCAATFKEGATQNQQAQALLRRAAGDAGVTLAIQQASQPARAQTLTQQRVDTLALPRSSPPVEIP